MVGVNRGGTTVSNTLQQTISKMRLRRASAVMMFVFVCLFGVVVVTQSVQAETFTVLYSFTGSPDGAYPLAGLIRDAAGNLYGTTYSGGTYGYGAVYKLETNGTETVLYSFTGGADGKEPVGGLVRDTAGNLYGVAGGGSYPAYGVVFKVDTSGTETVLHSFTGGNSDGCNPSGGLVRDKAGNLYGTTYGCGYSIYGTVFRVDAQGNEILLHSFNGFHGANPYYTSLLLDKKGNLYGVTSFGGTSNYGTVYRLSTRGAFAFTLLHSFEGGATDGCVPYGTPAMDNKGNLYGTATACGTSNLGILWKVSKERTETVLHNFAGGSSDGSHPESGVIMDAAGSLYGNTYNGGASDVGTVYELNKKGTLTLLHSFAGSDGEYPLGGVIMDASSNLYGTAQQGGSDYGTVWKLTPSSR